MIVYEDGSFFLEAGEAVPFLCPECGWPTPYSDRVTVVCEHCGHSGMAADFSEGRARLESPLQ
jgi:hypothetical protein